MSRKILLFVLLGLVCNMTLADDPADMAAAMELYELQQFQEAEKAFKRLDKSSDSALPSYYLALIYAHQGDLETATEYMEDAVERDSGQSDYHLKLGRYYGDLARDASIFKQMGLAKKSKAGFERAVELDGNNLDARSGLISFLLMAPGIAGGSEEEALAQAREVARRDSARGHFELARVYQQTGDAEAAEREYRAAISAAEPDNSNPWLSFGIYLNSEERFDEALELYRERLATQPDDMPIVYQLGRTVSISGQDLEAGRAAFAHYLDNHQPGPDEPGLDWAHYRLGLILLQMDEPTKARSEYQAALALNPDHPEAGKALKKLGRL